MSEDDDKSLLSSADLTSIENSSRLATEYNILGFLGSGGFGSVFLARNKLDGNDYAIKRISLGGMSQKQIERIKNEVAVFSRLTHGHIVRYYSSFIETVVMDPDTSETTSSESYNPQFSLENELPSRIRNLNNEDDVLSAETAESLEESTSDAVGFFRGGPQRKKIPAVLPNILSQGGSDLSIMFVGDEENEDESSTSEDISMKPKSVSFLCLQMEYCLNKTLRSLIDYSQLYANSAMIWRLFREILLGLEFMHSYNLIHRDIKPGNIFLDSQWNVKIGDFGLATRLATISKNTVDLDTSKENKAPSYSMTKDVGTTFYIPPEAKRETSSFGKNYDEKFDIYSLGIVLFEMILKPPDSRSERIKCLEALRSQLIMPDDYFKYLPESQQSNASSIIKWCLSDNPEERPSASELLSSNKLPNIISEEDRFHKTIIQVSQDPKHRLRRLLFTELFSPILPSPISFVYDKNYCLEMSKKRKIFCYNTLVITYLSDLFKLHGYSQLAVESLLPSPENYSIDEHYFSSLSKPYKVIDENGVILSLPTNLRQVLARYFAHNGITRLRSFSIDKTYFQSTNTSAYSSHPETRTEFCLDILRPKSSATDSTAIEILQMVIEICHKLRPLSQNKWQIIINHTALVKAIALHFSINDQQKLCGFFNLLYDFSSRLKKVEYNSLAFEFVRNFDITEKHANELIQLIESPNRSIHRLREHLRPIINAKNSEIRVLMEKAITQLDFVFQSLCQNLDSYLELSFLPSFIYQPLIFSDGLIFSLRVEINEKGKKFWCPILGGGCYDAFLKKSRQINEQSSNMQTSAYGFNISIENIAHLLKNSDVTLAEKFGLINSVFISYTSRSYSNSAQALARQLREIPMFVEIWNEETAVGDTLFEYCRDKFTNFIVVLVSTDELLIYLNTFDKSTGNDGFRLLHNRISLAEAFKFISNSMRKDQIESDIPKSTDVDRYEASNAPANATLSNVNIVFCISKGFKMTHHIKKKYESQVNVVLSNLVKKFTKNIKIDAYITELPVEIIKEISNLDRNGSDQAFVDFERIANSQSSKYKKDVTLLFDELESFFQQNTSNHVVFLFAPRYNFHRMMQ